MLFSGVSFVLIGFNSISEAQFRSEIVDNGGVDVGRYDPSCTHVIVHGRLHDDTICVAARSDGKTLVTNLWVEDSLDMGSLADANGVLYQPVKDLKGIPGSESLCMCLTGYQGTKRDNVMKMVEMMGAKFLKPLIASRVTHLICYKFEGEKYELAKRTNIELVNHQWLEDCLKAWKILPTNKYMKSGLELEIMEAEARDSEEETDVGVGKNTSSRKGLLTPRNSDTRTPLRESTEIDLNAAVAVGFNLNIPNNADILERSLLSTQSKVFDCERILGPTEPRNRVEDYHHLTACTHALSGKECNDVKNDACQNIKTANGELADLDKEAYNGSTSTSNKKRSPHLEASEEKFGTKTFSRKALRKSLQGISTLTHSSQNLVSRGKDAVDLSNIALEQPKNDLRSVEILTSSFLVQAHPKPDQSDTVLLEGKNDLDKEVYNGSPSTSNKKRSPHLEASEEKFGTKTFSRKALRKSLGGTNSSPQGNLVSRGKDAVHLSNIPLEQPKNDLRTVEILTSSFSVQARPKTDQSDILLPEGKDDLDKEVYNESASTSNKKSSPHLEASEENFGTKTFSRKALRKSLKGTHTHSSPQVNLLSRGEDAMDLSNIPLEQPKNDLRSVEILTSSFAVQAHPKIDQSDPSLLKGKDDLSRLEVSPPKLKDKNPKTKPLVAPTCPELEQISMSDKPENCARLCNSSAPMRDGPVSEPIVNQQGNLAKTKSANLKKKPLKRGRTVLQAKDSEAFVCLSNDIVTDVPIELDKLAESRCEINYLKAMETDHATDVENFARASGKSTGCSVEPKLDIKPENGDDTFSRLSMVSSNEMAKVHKQQQEGDLTCLNTCSSSKFEKLQNPRNIINISSSCLSRKKVMAKKNKSRKIQLATGKTSELNGENLLNLSEGLISPMNAHDAAELEEDSIDKGTEMPQLDPEANGKTHKELTNEALAPQNSSKAVLAVAMGGPFDAEKKNKPVQDRVKSGDKAREQKPAGKSEKKSVETNMASLSVAEPEPVWFILTGHHLLRKEFQQVIRRLRGRVCRDSHNWSYQATHFIVPDPVRRTEKFFAAAAAGRWILKADYLTASNEAGRFLDEEHFEWYRKGLNEDGAISLEAPRKWRQLRERTGHGAFYGMRIVIYGECIAPSLDTLKRVIKAGDGTILATCPPYTRFLKSGVDYAIISAGMPPVDCWVQEFLKHDIPCVLSDYLVEYVCKPGYSLERHVLYKTHPWAEKSFQNLLSRSEDDIPCEVCGSSDRGDVVLICGNERGALGCGVGIHIDCCYPPLEAVPEEAWFCSKCCTTRSNSNSNSGSSTRSKKERKRSSVKHR